MKELVSLIGKSVEKGESLTKSLGEALRVVKEYFAEASVVLCSEEKTVKISGANTEEQFSGNPFVEKVLRNGEKIILTGEKSVSELYMPLICNEKPCGVLWLKTKGNVSDDDIQNAEIISSMISLIVVHSKLRENVEDKLRKLELLYNVSREIEKRIKLDDLLGTVIKLLRTIFDMDNIAILLKGKRGKLKVAASTSGYNKSVVNNLSISITKGEGITGFAAKERKTVILNNVKNDPRYINGNENTKSEMAIPLIYKGKLLGVLDFESGIENRFTEEDKKMLEAVAVEISIAIENALLYEKLRELAEKDELTGLYNYRAFRKELDREISRSLRYGKKFSLVMFDIDFFKNYNDNNGHDVGNIALHKVGEIILKSSRKTDFPARFGGEEFIVILPETERSGAFIFADRIRSAIEKEPFPGEEKQPNGKLTVSGGIAEFPTDGDTAEKIIKAVDIAAYDAKESGRNRIIIFGKG